MTYCVALRLNRGLVFAADTRTNAGVDNIAQFRKVHSWVKPGERVLVLLTAGNLSLTQSVVSLLNEQLVEREEEPDAANLYNVPSMYRAARLLGLVHSRRPDRRRASTPVSGLLGRQLHRGDRRDAVLPDRRAQVRQADSRPRGAADDAARRGG
jgi:predicted proteasome-type protease